MDEERAAIDALIAILRPASVLEIGDVDETATGSGTADLVVGPTAGGSDRAGASRKAAASGRPRGSVSPGARRQATPSDASPQPTPPDDVLRSWLRACRDALVVCGEEVALVSALRRLDPELEVYPVQRAAGSSTVVALKPPAQRHRRDYRASMLPPLLDRHADIMGLVALRVCAWRSVGFYPNHAPRLWEYPFVAETLSRTLDPGSRIVDVGAGVTPLVPYLADLGYLLDTVDPSSIVRRWPPKPRWSEWGYLDYAAQGLARASWNCTLDRLPDEVSFDGAYSVSVIEHIPADARRAMLASLSDRLRPGAPLILTVDLKRGTDRLLNRCLGEVVEARERHGVFSDLTAEISEAGFHLLLADAVRGWGDVRVDIGYVVAERNASERV